MERGTGMAVVHDRDGLAFLFDLDGTLVDSVLSTCAGLA